MCSEERDKTGSNISFNEAEDEKENDDHGEKLQSKLSSFPPQNHSIKNPEKIDADNNNNSGNKEDQLDLENDESDDQTEMALDLSSNTTSSYHPISSNHVTLEALQNTKVAVAQFAATAMASSQNYEDAIQELALVQSTLFNLQHQQLLQMQIIRHLESQLSVNNKVSSKNSLDEVKDVDENEICEEKGGVHNENKSCDEEKPMKKLEKTDNSETCISILPEIKETKIEVKEDKRSSISSTTPLPPEKKPPERKPHISLQAPLCNINSSLACSIITNHDPPPPPDEPNCLEMLQKRTQEVLDSASQSFLGNNLSDEFQFGRDRSGQDGKGRNEPFFKHKCKYCGKVFGSDSALQIHIRSHTGERPFKCNVCASKFTTKGNLKVHYQRHTQRYPCVPIGPNCGPPEYVNSCHPRFMTSLPSGQIQSVHVQSNPNPNHGLHFPSVASVNGLPTYPSSSMDILRSHTIKSNQFTNWSSNSIQDQDEPADLSKTSKSVNAIFTARKDLDDIDVQSVGQLSKRLKENCTEDADADISNAETVKEEDESESMLDDYLSESEESEQEQPENLSKSSHRSSYSRNSSMSDSAAPDIVQLPAPCGLPQRRGGENNDVAWENLIEIDKISETSKLQELVDNIENKLSDPNQCLFCHKIMSCKSSLQMHLRTHTGEKPFRCKLCTRAFATKGNLKAHMNIHKIKPPMRSQYKCPICHQKYPNGSILQQHIRSHASEGIDISKELLQFSERDEAWRSGSLSDNFETTISEISGQPSELSQDDYDDLMDEENTEDKFRIEFNDDKMNRSREGSSLTTKNDKDDEKMMTLSNGALDLTPRSVQSEKLNGISSSSSNFPIISQASLNTTSPSFISGALSSLTQSVLPTSPFNPLGLLGLRGNTTCHICFKTFACNSALEIHFRSHTKDRPFKCSICDKAFSTKKEEIVHTALHFFNTKNGNIKQHMLTHKFRESSSNQNSNISSEDSSHASVSLKQDSPKSEHLSPSLKQQENEQSPTINPIYQFSLNENPDESKFGIKQSLVELRYPLCKNQNGDAKSPLSTTNQNTSLPKESTENQTTIQSQTPKKDPQLHRIESQPSIYLDPPVVNTKHLCTVCRKNFSSSSALQIHMRTHTGDKPFRCSVCQKAFTTKGNLKVHMGTHMWTNGSSRRGRRMSLELPLNRPLPIAPQDEFIQRRSDFFYPYLPPFLNGMQQKFSEMTSMQNPQSAGYPGVGHLPSSVTGKYSGFLGFSPFLPHPNAAAVAAGIQGVGYHQTIPMSPRHEKRPPTTDSNQIANSCDDQNQKSKDMVRMWNHHYRNNSANAEAHSSLEEISSMLSSRSSNREEAMAV